MPRFVLRGIVVGVAGAGVAGLLVVALLLAAAVLAAVGLVTPLTFVQNKIRRSELWLAFLVSAFATGGSLFFSEVAHFTPCLLCWYERACMYPLSIATLVAAVLDARRAARWLLPVPLVGAGLSVYHVLIENGLAPQTIGCLQSLPGGCGLKWIEEFGFVTIPVLALTGFALLTALLLIASLNVTTAIPKSAVVHGSKVSAA